MNCTTTGIWKKYYFLSNYTPIITVHSPSVVMEINEAMSAGTRGQLRRLEIRILNAYDELNLLERKTKALNSSNDSIMVSIGLVKSATKIIKQANQLMDIKQDKNIRKNHKFHTPFVFDTLATQIEVKKMHRQMSNVCVKMERINLTEENPSMSTE